MGEVPAPSDGQMVHRKISSDRPSDSRERYAEVFIDALAARGCAARHRAARIAAQARLSSPRQADGDSLRAGHERGRDARDRRGSLLRRDAGADGHGELGPRQACEPISRFALSHQVPMVMVMPFRGDLRREELVGPQPCADDGAPPRMRSESRTATSERWTRSVRWSPAPSITPNRASCRWPWCSAANASTEAEREANRRSPRVVRARDDGRLVHQLDRRAVG